MPGQGGKPEILGHAIDAGSGPVFLPEIALRERARVSANENREKTGETGLSGSRQPESPAAAENGSGFTGRQAKRVRKTPRVFAGRFPLRCLADEWKGYPHEMAAA